MLLVVSFSKHLIIPQREDKWKAFWQRILILVVIYIYICIEQVAIYSRRIDLGTNKKNPADGQSGTWAQEHQISNLVPKHSTTASLPVLERGPPFNK